MSNIVSDAWSVHLHSEMYYYLMNVPNHAPSIDAAWVVGDKELHDAGVVASTHQMEGSLSLLQIETTRSIYIFVRTSETQNHQMIAWL